MKKGTAIIAAAAVSLAIGSAALAMGFSVGLVGPSPEKATTLSAKSEPAANAKETPAAAPSPQATPEVQVVYAQDPVSAPQETVTDVVEVPVDRTVRVPVRSSRSSASRGSSGGGESVSSASSASSDPGGGGSSGHRDDGEDDHSGDAAPHDGGGDGANPQPHDD